MRRLLLGAGIMAAACVAGDSDKEAPTLAEGEVYAQLFEQGIVSCDEPHLRDAQRFDVDATPEQPVPEYNLAGGGLLVEDLDADGWMDLFLPSVDSAQLFFGTGGSFEAAHSRLSGLPLSDSVGATAVDYDADGDLDVFVARWLQPNTLLRNDGNRVFVDVTEQAFGGGAPAFRSQSASWGDIDADGDLDLFVGSYGEWAKIDVNEPVANCDDHVPDPAELWRNEGDGTFTDVSHELPQEVHDGYSFMSGFYDIDDDGYPELFSAHDDGNCAPSVLVDNEAGALSIDTASNFHPNSHDMGMGVGDLNGDELPDFLLTTWKGVYFAQSSNGYWVDAANAVGLEVADQQVYGWGAELGDVDNDGDLDAAMVFGFWTAFDGAGDPLKQPDGLWINDGGTFADQGPAWGLDEEGISRGVVLADIDNDGWLDVVKRILDAGTPVHLSRCGEQAWLRVRVQQPGRANTHGVGTKVRITTGGESRIRWIHSGSAGMYSGAPLEAHFGLGDVENIDLLEVFWPDGRVSVFEDVAPRQQVQVIRQAERQ